MKERDIQTLFSKVINKPGVYELKLAKGNSLPYNAVKEHQIDALLKVKNDGLFHKISDQPIFGGMKTRFTKPKPFDCFFVKSFPAYVAICFYKPRQNKIIRCIDIDKYIESMNSDTRKSITEERAMYIQDFCVEL